MPQSSREEKKRHLDDMLQHGRGMVMVHLDPRRDGVRVPPQFTADPVLRLNIAYGFNLPSLEVDETGVYAMLSFGGRRFGCNLPWDAIFALTMPDEDHRGVVWPDDLPRELRPFFDAIDGNRDANLAAVQLGGAVVAGSEPAPAPMRATLSLVSADADATPSATPETPQSVEAAPQPDSDADETGDSAQAPEEPTPRQRPTLRLVK